jgi:hypothetical protein
MAVARREDLHRLLDDLPESDLPIVLRVLEALSASPPGPVYSHEDAPVDDEPTSPEEDAASAEAWAEYERGEALSAEEAKRLLLS